MTNKPIIQRVWASNTTGQKSITIPKDSGIEEGDFVKVIKMEIKEKRR